jgi:hypothetical protein
MDSHLYPDYLVPPNYDSLLGKLIVWAEDRDKVGGPLWARERGWMRGEGGRSLDRPSGAGPSRVLSVAGSTTPQTRTLRPSNAHQPSPPRPPHYPPPQAITRMLRALDETVIVGVPTTGPFHKLILNHPAFRAGDVDTGFIPKYQEELTTPPPEPKVGGRDGWGGARGGGGAWVADGCFRLAFGRANPRLLQPRPRPRQVKTFLVDRLKAGKVKKPVVA